MILEKSNKFVTNLAQFLHSYVQNTFNFVFKIWEIVERIQTDVDRLLLFLVMENKFPKEFAKIRIFQIFQFKVVFFDVSADEARYNI